MAWAVSGRKPFFVGARSIEIQGRREAARKLVGFILVEPAASAPEECCLVIRDGNIAGRITSAMRSPTIGRVIGLAFVQPDQAESGIQFDIRRPNGELVPALVAKIPFYDPENARQDA